MKKILSIMLSTIFILCSCTPKADTNSTPTPPVNSPANSSEKVELPKKTEVFRLYGKELETINYLDSASEIEFELAANVLDTLIEYDRYGVVKPSLATSWSVSPDGLEWTFKIREGVKWVDYEGTEVSTLTAHDFVTAMHWLVNSENASRTANILFGTIKNSEQFFNKEITDINLVGVKAIDDYTLVYSLEQPVPYFLSMLTYTCFMPVDADFLEEMGEQFGTDHTTMLYNGAFYLSSFEPQSSHKYIKNELNWDKDNVFITTINETFNKEQATIETELFLRGETTKAYIPPDLRVEWLKDPEKAKIISPSRNLYYSYFYALNFDPQFDAQYEPENWKVAVNNKNFRKALFHAFDRTSAMLTEEPYDPTSRLSNAITPKNFVSVDGVDYTQLVGLAKFDEVESFDQDLAIDYKAKALTELTGKATFPIKILISYNPSDTHNWAKRTQVFEQQIETLLGKDFVDVIVEQGPATSFLSEVRRSGKFAVLECNWGPDYADPETYSAPFDLNGSYGKPQMALDYTDPNGLKTYTNLINAAKAERTDIEARYEALAKAEAFLIEEAFVIPYAVSNPGYTATYLNIFEAAYSPFGISYLRYKGQKIMDEPMSPDKFATEYAKWLLEREDALKAANQ